MTVNNFNELTTLKKIVDNLNSEGKIPVNYVSFRQAYKMNTIDSNITQYIVEVKKYTSTSYYIKNSDLDNFKEAIISHFN